MNGKKAKDLRKAARYLVNNKMTETKTTIPDIAYKIAKTTRKWGGPTGQVYNVVTIQLDQCTRWVYQNLKKDYKAGKFTITTKAA